MVANSNSFNNLFRKHRCDAEADSLHRMQRSRVRSLSEKEILTKKRFSLGPEGEEAETQSLALVLNNSGINTKYLRSASDG